jgi:hypothetical protein
MSMDQDSLGQYRYVIYIAQDWGLHLHCGTQPMGRYPDHLQG